jgi:hypothetical protein
VKRSGSQLTFALALLAVVSVTVSACVSGGWVTYSAGPRPDHLAVAWADHGNLAVAQIVDRKSVPTVIAWDRTTGRRSILTGYRLVGAEPAAPRAWLVRDTASDRAADAAVDLVGDTIDSVPAGGLLAWSPGSAPEGTSGPVAHWQPWDGPDGRVASMSLDPARAAMPQAISFRRPGGGWTGPAPLTTARSFQPVGWSPSGKYFAVQTLENPEAEADAAMLEDPAAATQELPHLVILSTDSGKVVAEASPMLAQGPFAAWDARVDRIFYATYSDAQSADPTATLEAIDVTGPVGPSKAPELVRAVEALGIADGMGVVGGGPKGPMVAVSRAIEPGVSGTGTELWRIEPDGAHWVGTIEDHPLDIDVWSEAGGLLSITDRWGVVVLDELGQERARLWPDSPVVNAAGETLPADPAARP